MTINVHLKSKMSKYVVDSDMGPSTCVLVLYLRKYFLIPAGVFLLILKYQMWVLLCT